MKSSTERERTGHKTLLEFVLFLGGLVVLLLLTTPLYTIHGLSHYLPLHMVLETASLVVAFSTFSVVWNAYSEERAGNIVLLALGMMAAGLIDFAHMLSYPGMPDFITPGSTEKAINFWLVARLLTAVTFLVVALRPWRPLANPGNRFTLLTLTAIVTGLVYWAGLYHPHDWPHTFIEGEGLTRFKITAEYIVIALFAFAAAAYYHSAGRGGYRGAMTLAAAASISVLSELCFTFYTDVSDTFNLLGHIYKVIAFMLVFSSVYIDSVREPFEKLRANKAALAESQQRLQTIFDTAQDGIVVADAESKRLIMANQAFCDMLGVSEEELRRMGISDIHPAQHIGKVAEQFERQLRGEIAVAEDIPVLRRDGTVFYADFNSAPLEIDGRTSLLGMVRDTTERRQMEQELATSRERLALALDGSHDGLFDWDIEHNLVYYSPRWKEQLGYQENELGNSYDEWRKRLHPDDRETVHKVIQALRVGTTERLEYEYRMRHRNGHWIWLLARGNVIYDRHDRPVRLIGTHMDITAIKSAQQSEAEARLQLRERLKEMQCLYHVTALQTEIERPIGELLQQVVEYLTPSLFYPEEAVARIRFDDERFTTAGFNESDWQLQAAITLDGVVHGDITVSYLSPQPPADIGPFLQEEQELIEAVATQLVAMIKLRDGQAMLRRINRILRTLSESNRSLVQARSERELAESLCRVLVGDGNYTRAWIGYLDEKGERLQQLATAQAPGIELPDLKEVILDEDAYLLYRVIQKGRTQIQQSLEGGRCHLRGCSHSPNLCNTAIALPLKINGEVIGAMVVCGADHTGIEPREVALFEELASDITFGISNLRTRGERDDAVTALEGVLLQTIDAISRTVEKRDPYTAGHQHRVAQLAEAIAREMGLSESQITGIRLGSTIHDIGKIYIPAELLNRPGKLSNHEFALIKSHPAVGYDIVKDVDFHWPVSEMIRQHHERLDGSGYPDGLQGEEIILEARILAVADVIEAIAAHRPYRAALGVDKGLEVIQQGSGTQFDADVVDCCVQLFQQKGFAWE